MRILHVISGIDPSYGGPIAALAGLAEAQASVGLDVTVVATYAAGQDVSPADKIRAKGVTVQLIGPASGALFRHPDIIPMLQRLIADADIIHVHALWEEIQHRACRLARAAGKPYLIRACGMLDPWSLNQNRLKKQLYMLWRLRKNLNRAAAIHASSQMEAQLIGRLRLRAPVIVEPNGVDLNEFNELPPPGTFRSRYAQLAGRKVIAYLGRIHPQKGLELLIPALAKLPDRSAMLVVIGPDSDNFKATVERLIEENAVKDRVIFTGALRGADKAAALADADLFALPSYHENFGIAVIEALAVGVPVVVSDHVYIHEEISRAGVGGVCGLHVNQVAAEISRFLSDDSLRQAAASRARAFVWQNYDWKNIAARWQRHYHAFTQS